ncbi:sodium- and chloride-dependent neutral and basic amino acid transporter B(0+)-like isoform X2 [Narcine bancroftii]|uniref:sodium- and chloride-dependent neutral and basic amino acid transporter B(0+)-like isoform X2 n=1 Tax=Narcine bancroftii TaxID=1343680 RepID=UPI003831A07E
MNATTVTEGYVGKKGKTVERISWSSKTDYLLSVIGSAVGLGNVWRFPYLAYKNGGGVGITMVIVVMFFNISYNCIIAYSLFYLFASFQSPLPWADCFSWWGADETCRRTPTDPLCNLTLESGNPENVNRTWLLSKNKTCSNRSEIHVLHQGPSEQYWDKVALQRSSSMEEMGTIVWHLALCLLLAWLVVVAALSKGIKSSGKVVYFSAIFPYVVLTILLIQGLTLQGASKGMEFYIGSQSDISKLADTEVWKDAATQIFYSLAVGWGCLLTFSSYNKFHNNCFRDTVVVCVVNCGTSVLAGFVIFSVLGHMAHVQDKLVSEVVQSGFSLAFIAYPEALAQLPWAPLWSTLFFLMLLTLGFDTQFAALEMIITTLVDQFPHLLQSKRLYLTAGLSLVFYFLGLVFVTKAGIYWINLIDYFCTGWILITIALLELIGLSWIYGVSRFIKDIEMMIGERNWLFWLWWRVCWGLITPCLLVAILTWSLATFSPPTYGSVEYPGWAIALGWCMIILCIVWIPIIALVRIAQAEGSTLYQKISAACSSAPDWGPYLEQHRGERYKTKLHSIEGPHQVQLLPRKEHTRKLLLNL